MARGRLISRTLGSSRRFAALHQTAGKLAEFAQSLYPILVANADDFGRQAGDAFTVKYAVFPSSPRKESEFHAALIAMQAAGLLDLYGSDKGDVIQILNFDEHQPNLHKRAEKSRFPDSPGNSGAFPEFPPELKRTELKGTEGKRTAHGAGDDGFEAFWYLYPKKKSRSDAEKAWRKLAPSPELIRRIYDAVAAQRKSSQWLKDDGQFIPYAASWLNAKRWEDGEDLPAQAGPSYLACDHTPRCNSPQWCMVVRARARGEAV